MVRAFYEFDKQQFTIEGLQDIDNALSLYQPESLNAFTTPSGGEVKICTEFISFPRRAHHVVELEAKGSAIGQGSP